VETLPFGAGGCFVVKKFLFFIIPFLIGVLLFMLIGFYVFYYYTEDLPDPETLLPASARILYSNGDPLYLSKSLWMNLDEVPKIFIRMLLASEDRGFYKHAGLRIKGIIRAIWVNFVTRNPTAQGGSTMTQQLVRTLYLSPRKTIERKIKEMMIALWLERHRSKDEILEMYINSVYLGNGLYGFGVASIYYFGKPLKDLDVAQMAVLIGIVKSPENFNPFASEKMAKIKGKVVLKAAFDAGVLDRSEVEKAKVEIDNMTFKKEKYFFDEEVFWRVVREAQEVTGLSLQELRSGYEIVTTLDEKLQNIVEKEIKEDMACVAVDKSGKILAFKGKEASVGRRQLGSAIKPMYYLYAFLNGYSPSDVVPDLPIKIGDWEPNNFTKRFRGYSTLGYALVWSRNVPSVMLFSHLGYNNVVPFIKNVFKIEGHYPEDMTIALGTLETSPEEILKFYISLSTGGIVVKPTIIKEIRRISGGTIYKFIPEIIGKVPDGKVSSFDAIKTLKGVLRETARGGTGRKAWIKEKEMFGKTGTVDSNAWFIGGDDEFVMAIVKDGKNLMGGEDVAPVWKRIVQQWGGFKGKLTYKKMVIKDDGDLIFDDRMLRYFNYDKILEGVKSGRVSYRGLLYFLSKLKNSQREIFLGNLDLVSRDFVKMLRKEIGGNEEWKK